MPIPKPQTSKEVIAENVKLLMAQLEAGHSEGLTALPDRDGLRDRCRSEMPPCRTACGAPLHPRRIVDIDDAQMPSQPATKIFMKTAEPKAAEWISEAISKVEIERLKETKFDGSRSGKNFAVDNQIEPLVMGSEISALDDRSFGVRAACGRGSSPN